MLSRRIVERLERKNMDHLTEIQKIAIPKILENRDVLIIAPTGSGKTESAMLPVFQKILDMKQKQGILALYITPLRALNRDMVNRLKEWGDELGISVDVRHGDSSQSRRRKQSLNPPQVLITTPETLQILFLGRNLRKWLKNLKWVIIDEFHELMDSERGAQLSIAVERLREIADFKIIALSATISNEEEALRFLGRNVEVVRADMKREMKVEAVWPSQEDVSELVETLFVDERVAETLVCLKNIIESHRSTLIFVNTRQTAEALGLKLKRMGCSVEVHHGSLSRDARIEAEKNFSQGNLKALICTSSMELGIDIGSVDAVVQFHSPREVERLVQRVGRSGHRVGLVAKGFIIVNDFDDALESIAIIDLMNQGKLEKKRPHLLSLDTIANQICGMALEYGKISEEKVFGIIKRAYPFKDLRREVFDEIVEFLTRIGIIRYSDGVIIAGRRTREYFYGNISMIPDESRKDVYDIVSRRYIGSLDESFLMDLEEDMIVIRGELWKVVEIDDVVKVEPVAKEGVIPSWIGEEIPVPFQVAQKVGEIRRWIGELIRSEGAGNTVREIMERYPVNVKLAEEVVRVISDQIRKNFEIPDERTITIEGSNGNVVVNACFGHRVNEALGKILSVLLSARYGSTVNVESDPYRIKLSLPSRVTYRDVMELMLSLNPDHIEFLAEKALARSKLLKWKVIHSGRKFGYFRKEYEDINLDYVIRKIMDTPVYREALREIFHDRLDITTLRDIIGRLGSTHTLAGNENLSPISIQKGSSSFELVMPEKPTQAILNALKRRIMEEEVILKCLHCGFRRKRKVRDVEENIECPVCRSKLISAFSPFYEKEIEKDRNALYRRANLVYAYGKRAVIALSAYGVGPDTAVRILSVPGSEDEFFGSILRAERNYVRTRKFWD